MIDRWIKTYEKLLKWEWYGDPIMVATWIHLLLKANWCDKKWRGITIKRGQLITSRTRLADEIGLTERQLRTCLERMQSSCEIACETTNRYTIITICNYDIYQDKTDSQRQAERPDESHTNDQQTTNKRPAGGQQTTTTIEVIEEKINYKSKEDQKCVCDAPAREEFLETFGLLHNVKIAPEQHRHLVEDYGQQATDETIDDLSCKLADGSVDSSNHYATLLSWLRYQRRSGGTVPLSIAKDDPVAKRAKELRDLWNTISVEEQRQHLQAHNNIYPWDDPDYNEQLKKT